jgi:ribosomal protein S27E
MRTIEKQNSGQVVSQTVGQVASQEVMPALSTPTLEVVRCPNCGSLAERYYSATQQRLQCDHCDYLLTTCAKTGRVIEAYAPGLSFTAQVASISVSAAVSASAKIETL